MIYYWVEGNWSTCPTSCGQSMGDHKQYRVNTCEDYFNVAVSNDNCVDEDPFSTEQDCPSTDACVLAVIEFSIKFRIRLGGLSSCDTHVDTIKASVRISLSLDDGIQINVIADDDCGRRNRRGLAAGELEIEIITTDETTKLTTENAIASPNYDTTLQTEIQQQDSELNNITVDNITETTTTTTEVEQICVDDDIGLQEQSGNSSLTCALSASFCELDENLPSLCCQTCNPQLTCVDDDSALQHELGDSSLTCSLVSYFCPSHPELRNICCQTCDYVTTTEAPDTTTKPPMNIPDEELADNEVQAISYTQVYSDITDCSNSESSIATINKSILQYDSTVTVNGSCTSNNSRRRYLGSAFSYDITVIPIDPNNLQSLADQINNTDIFKQHLNNMINSLPSHHILYGSILASSSTPIIEKITINVTPPPSSTDGGAVDDDTTTVPAGSDTYIQVDNNSSDHDSVVIVIVIIVFVVIGIAGYLVWKQKKTI